MISKELLEEILRRSNFASIAGRYAQLQEEGPRELRGPCPFHEDKLSSFQLNVTAGVFHCFICRDGGDLFKFFQRAENCSFAEAVARLAEEVGVKIPPE